MAEFEACHDGLIPAPTIEFILMTDTQLRQLAADILNGKTNPETIPSGWVFIKIQNTAIKLGRTTINQEMMAISRKRLLARGYIELEGIGYKTREEIADSDLVQKNGRWYVGDPRRRALANKK